jgi:hypothetical protein
MFISTVATAAGTFVVTSSGIRYVITREFDSLI